MLGSATDNEDLDDEGNPITRPSGDTEYYYIKLENGGVMSNSVKVKQDKANIGYR